MRFYCRKVVFWGCCVVLLMGALVLGGCASSGRVGGGQDGLSSARRVPMRPFRRPVSTVVEVERVDWPFGLYQWPDPWVPLMVYNRSGVMFFNAKGEIYRTYGWLQDGGEGRSGLWVLDVQGDGMPSIVAAGEPTLILRSNADVEYVRPRGCEVMVGIEAVSGRRQLRCRDGAGAGEVGARPLEGYVVKRHGGHGVDEGFFFDFDQDGEASEFARLGEEGLVIVSRGDGEVIADLSVRLPVEGMMVADLDGDGVEELVVLGAGEVLIVRGEDREVLRWPTDTRRYGRVVVVEATEVVGTLLAREVVPALVGDLGGCFEDEMGLLYDKPDAILQVVLSVGAGSEGAGSEENLDGGDRVEYSVVRGYLYDEQLACVGRVLEGFEVPVGAGGGQSSLRFRVRVNWRDALAAEIAVSGAVKELRGARRLAESRAESRESGGLGVDWGGLGDACVAFAGDLDVDSEGWVEVVDREGIADWVGALGGEESGGRHADFGRAAADGGAMIPPVGFLGHVDDVDDLGEASVRVFVRCVPDFDGDGRAERLVKFAWRSALDSPEVCDSEVESGDVPCYAHRLHVLFSSVDEAETDWRALAVIADHYIGYMHDRHTLFGTEYRNLADGRVGVPVTFTNRDARTGCFFGSSVLMVYEEGQFVRAPGVQRQLLPCFADMDRALPEVPSDLRCPGIHQLENIEGYKRAGYAEIYDHGRGDDFRCFRLPGSLTKSVKQ